MLQSIVRNILFNAIKFTASKGHIWFSAKSCDTNTIKINVRDTGIGMNPQTLENLFRLGAQTSRKGTNGESSTGLGLQLCHEFVLKHGGSISVESEEGKGSTITVTLPWVP